MQKTPVPIATLTIPQLLTVHNALAAARGKEVLRSWHDSHCRLVERVAIVRTFKPLPPRVRRKPKPIICPKAETLSEAATKLLRRVVRYELRATGKKIGKRNARSRPPREVRSVGLSYTQIQAALRASFPYNSVSGGQLRVYLARAKQERLSLPEKRPRSSWDSRSTWEIQLS